MGNRWQAAAQTHGAFGWCRFNPCRFTLEAVGAAAVGADACRAVEAIDSELLQKRSEVLGFQSEFRAVRSCY